MQGEKLLSRFSSASFEVCYIDRDSMESTVEMERRYQINAERVYLHESEVQIGMIVEMRWYECLGLCARWE